MSRRARKWVRRTNPDLVIQAYRASRPTQEETGQAAQEMLDMLIAKVEPHLDRRLANPMQKTWYISYAQRVDRYIRNFTKEIATSLAAGEAVSWYARGLELPLLIEIARILGLEIGEEVDKLQKVDPSLIERVTTLEVKVANLEDSITSINNRLTTLEARVSDLSTRLTNLENDVNLLSNKTVALIGVAKAGYIFNYNTIVTIQPYSGDTGASVGMTLVRAGQARNLAVYVLSNTLDGDTYLYVRRNETNTPISVVIPAGETGLFTDETNTIDYPKYSRIDFFLDTTSSTTGDIDIVSIFVEYKFT
ncbi:MAG: hypothetical protein QXH97_00280 [Candidatus Bathyarchaeia archaeon]